MEELLCISGAVIIAGDDFEIKTDTNLLARGGRILAIGDCPPGARRLDMSGHILCPMFVDSHCHLGDTGAKELGVGRPLPEAVIPPNGLKHRFMASLEPEQHIQMMRHGLQEMLRNGIIACADFREQGLAGIRAIRQAAAGLPVRLVALGRMAEGGSPESQLEEGRALLQEADGLGIRDVTSYAPQVLERLRAEFPQKIFAAHAAESRVEEQLSIDTTGRTQVARALDWGPNFLVHLIYSREPDLLEMVRRGLTAVSCPRSNGILGDGLPDLALWRRLGVPMALGTDNVMFCAPDMLREMEYASRMARGLANDPTVMDNRALLQAATLNGARALGLQQSLGSLAPGKEASFLAFDTNRLNLRYIHDPLSAIVNRASVADISAVFIGGEQLSLPD